MGALELQGREVLATFALVLLMATEVAQKIDMVSCGGTQFRGIARLLNGAGDAVSRPPTRCP